MAPTRSIAELQSDGIVFRAEEAVAIAQQLIHNGPSGDCRIEPPFGPPSADGVLVDETGLVTCSTCESTLGVSEAAIFLQQLLPVGTPRVPGALRYMIARALHDVDAPPFDSIDEFSAGLARFERGDRVEVIRGLVERINSEAVPTDGMDRRQRMPSASDFRRELRAADARLYAQHLALRGLPPAGAPPGLPPRPPAAPVIERRRTATIAAGILAGVTLIGVGELMHERSTTAVEVAPAPQTQDVLEAQTPAQEPIVEPVAARRPAVRNTQGVTTSKVTHAVSSASRADKPKPAAKSPSRRPAATGSPRNGQKAPGKLDRLHLGWLRNMLTVKTEPL